MNIADYLHGIWRVERVIDDRLAGQTTRFSGTAAFTDSDEGLAYLESGVHEAGEHSLIAERRYRYVIDGSEAQVLFEDGRPFHALSLSNEPSNVIHMCANDEYAGTFVLTSENSWQSEWKVSGPNKDYVSTTSYSRSPGF